MTKATLRERVRGPNVEAGAHAAMTARVQPFSDELRRRQGDYKGRARSVQEQDPAALRAALDELQLQHEELIVADEELRAQVEKLERVTKRAALDRQRLRALFDSPLEAHFVTDLAGVMQEVNGAFAQMLGWKASFLRKKPLSAFSAGDDTRGVREVISEGVSTGACTARLSLSRRDGRAIVASLDCTLVDAGASLLWTARDATEASTTIAEPGAGPSRTATLERALRERDELLAKERAARALLEKVELARERFIAVLSHDLRGPIHTVLGWTQLMRRDVFGPEARTRALGTIERAARSQLALVEELLDVSRIAADKMHVELSPVDLTHVVSRVVEALTPAATTDGVDLALTTPTTGAVVVLGDRRRLEQIVTNLVANAVKFTRPAGRVDVAVRREGGIATVEVRDTGRGIPSEVLSTVFEAFNQHGEHNVTRSGLGLGLYIVRHLVELHAGVVDVQSDGQGRGATFTVRLPCRDLVVGPVSEHALPEEVPTYLDGLRVLVVDDEQDARELMGTTLTRSGADVALAMDGPSALTMFDACHPDIVVSDIGLANDDGCDLLQLLRARAPTIVAIAVSGFAARSDAQRAMAAGFDAHIAKPLEPARLVEAVHALTNGRRRESGFLVAHPSGRRTTVDGILGMSEVTHAVAGAQPGPEGTPPAGVQARPTAGH